MKENDSILGFLRTDLVVRALPESTVQDSVMWMAQAGVDCVMIESCEILRGIFTGHDLIQRVVGAGKDPAATRLDSVMTPEVTTLPETADRMDAIRLMKRSGFHHLPVTNKNQKVIAIVSTLDLLAQRNRQLDRLSSARELGVL